MSSRCRFSTHCASIASASLSLTTRTGTLSSSASLAALRRRAPAITSYLLSSSSRTNNGARTPWLLKLAANSPRLFSSNRLRGLLDDSIRAVTDTSRYSWFCETRVCISYSPFVMSSVFRCVADLVELNSERDVLCWYRLRNRRRTVRNGIRFRISRIALSRFRFRGDSSENHGSGLLHRFQTLA